jgi:hypothetical protein
MCRTPEVEFVKVHIVRGVAKMNVTIENIAKMLCSMCYIL